MGRLRDETSARVPSRAGAGICATTAPLSFSLTRLVLCSYYARLGAVPRAFGRYQRQLRAARGARERLEPRVYCNVIVPAFGLLVWLEPHRQVHRRRE